MAAAVTPNSRHNRLSSARRGVERSSSRRARVNAMLLPPRVRIARSAGAAESWQISNSRKSCCNLLRKCKTRNNGVREVLKRNPINPGIVEILQKIREQKKKKHPSVFFGDSELGRWGGTSMDKSSVSERQTRMKATLS